MTASGKLPTKAEFVESGKVDGKVVYDRSGGIVSRNGMDI
jgi:hypothetical protein